VIDRNTRCLLAPPATRRTPPAPILRSLRPRLVREHMNVHCSWLLNAACAGHSSISPKAPVTLVTHSFGTQWRPWRPAFRVLPGVPSHVFKAWRNVVVTRLQPSGSFANSRPDSQADGWPFIRPTRAPRQKHELMRSGAVLSAFRKIADRHHFTVLTNVNSSSIRQRGARHACRVISCGLKPGRLVLVIAYRFGFGGCWRIQR